MLSLVSKQKREGGSQLHNQKKRALVEKHAFSREKAKEGRWHVITHSKMKSALWT